METVNKLLLKKASNMCNKLLIFLRSHVHFLRSYDLFFKLSFEHLNSQHLNMLSVNGSDDVPLEITVCEYCLRLNLMFNFNSLIGVHFVYFPILPII